MLTTKYSIQFNALYYSKACECAVSSCRWLMRFHLPCDDGSLNIFVSKCIRMKCAQQLTQINKKLKYLLIVLCLVRFCDSIMFGVLRLIIASLKTNVILMLPRQKNYAWIFISIIIEMTCTKWTCITKSLAHNHHHYWQNLF